MNRKCATSSLAGLAVVLLIGWLAVAAPILPSGRKLTVEQRTLRGLKKVRLEVTPITGELKENGVRTQTLTDVLEEAMAEFGIQVVDEPDVPLVKVVVFDATDPDQPDALAISFVIAIHQDIVLKRLDEQMVVPTAFFTQTKLTTKSRASEMVEYEVRAMTKRVLRIASEASAAD